MFLDSLDGFIKSTEEDISRFLQFIRDLERDYEEGSENGSFSEPAAVFEAIHLARNALDRLSNLLYQFSNLACPSDSGFSDDGSTVSRHYYDQYVCQIVVYLLKIIELNIHRLIQRLDTFPAPVVSTSRQEVFANQPSTSKGPGASGAEPAKPIKMFEFNSDRPAVLFRGNRPIVGPLFHNTAVMKVPVDRSIIPHQENPPGSSGYKQAPTARLEDGCLDDGNPKESNRLENDIQAFFASFAAQATKKKHHDQSKRSSSSSSDDQVDRRTRNGPRWDPRKFNPKPCSNNGTKSESSDSDCDGQDMARNPFPEPRSNNDLEGAQDRAAASLRALIRDLQQLESLMSRGKETIRSSLSSGKSPEPKRRRRKSIIKNEVFPKCCSTLCRKCCPDCRELHKTSRDEETKSLKKKNKFSLHSSEEILSTEEVKRRFKARTGLRSSSEWLPTIQYPDPRRREVPPEFLGREKAKNTVSTGTLKPRYLKVENKAKEQAKPAFHEEKEAQTKERKVSSGCQTDCVRPTEQETSPKSPPKSDAVQSVFKRAIEGSAIPETVVFNIEDFSQTLVDKIKQYRSEDTADKTEMRNSVFKIFLDSVQGAIDAVPKLSKETVQKEHFDPTSAAKKPASEADSTSLHFMIRDAVKAASRESSEEGRILSLPDKILIKKPKRGKIKLACEDCTSRLVRSESQQQIIDLDSVMTSKAGRQCFSCWNAHQKGRIVHRCHDNLPDGILEVRHMDPSGTGMVCVCHLPWRASEEPDDWRWLKNPFHDPTRVEMMQTTSYSKTPVLKVLYGPVGTMVKESVAETKLATVKRMEDRPRIRRSIRSDGSHALHRTRSDTRASIAAINDEKKEPRQVGLISGIREMEERLGRPSVRTTMTKLGRLFDDVQKFGYGRGPPLIIILRSGHALNDAYDLLMVSSQIPLNYYRSIRVLFVGPNRPITPSDTDFREEDRSDELFRLFERQLFQVGDRKLFEYPSEDSHCLYLNPNSDTHPQWFVFAGTVLALAFMHQKRMNIGLSEGLYKCLLDRPLDLSDLREINNSLYDKLVSLKNNKLDPRTRSLTFTIRERCQNGDFCQRELMPNGHRIQVTENNKFRYIDLALKWVLAERCLSELKDFRRGFASVFDPSFLTLLTVKEFISVIRSPLDPEMFFDQSKPPTGTSNNGKPDDHELKRRNTD